MEPIVAEICTEKRHQMNQPSRRGKSHESVIVVNVAEHKHIHHIHNKLSDKLLHESSRYGGYHVIQSTRSARNQKGKRTKYPKRYNGYSEEREGEVGKVTKNNLKKKKTDVNITKQCEEEESGEEKRGKRRERDARGAGGCCFSFVFTISTGW